MFPKALGAVLIVAGGCYIVDLLGAVLFPDIGQKIHPLIGAVPTAIAELSMVGYLLIIGVKTVKTEKRILAAA